jgi:hypothetical protein
MVQIVLVGLGAGAASALLLASIASGSIAAVLLVYLSPLPILIAALGWSHLAGLIAAASATAAVAIFARVFLVAVPVVAFGAWWLGYLTLLARPSANSPADTLEWYPVGRLVLWGAVIGTLVVAVTVPLFGTDQESLQAAVRKLYERILTDKAMIDFVVIAIPAVAAAFSTVICLVNLWLAARIVRVSGRLSRPWPDLAALTLPPAALGLLAAAIAGSFLPDLIGVLSAAFAASLLMAFAILGFAVLHAITRGHGSRGIVLAGTYAAAVTIGWPVLAMSVLGLADTVLDIRQRVARKRGPPSLRT